MSCYDAVGAAIHELPEPVSLRHCFSDNGTMSGARKALCQLSLKNTLWVQSKCCQVVPHCRRRMGRMFSPLSRSALAVASVEAQAKRRKQRVHALRERFKRVSLSSGWQESAIVQSVVGMFRMSADVTRMLRTSSGSQFVGAGYRPLRMENLEGRQMLSVNVPSMPDLDTASDTGPSTTRQQHERQHTDIQRHFGRQFPGQGGCLGRWQCQYRH